MAAIFAVAALVYVFAVAFLVADARIEARARFDREVSAVARVAADEVADESAAVVEFLGSAAGDLDWEPILRGEIACEVGIAPIGIFSQIRADVVLSDGTVLCSTGESPAAPPALDLVLGSNEPLLLSPYAEPGRQATVLAAAARLDSASDVPLGAVVLVLDLAPLAEGLSRNLAGLGFSFSVHAGNSVVSRDSDTTAADDPRSLHASAPVPGQELTVRAHIGEDRVLGVANDATRSLATAGSFGFACLAAALWALNRRLVRPLTALREGVETGDPAGLPAQPVGPAEVASLQEALGTMMRTQANHAEELRRQAFVDPLTGLPNRTALGQSLDSALEDMEHSLSVVVVLLAVLRFDVLNDSWGQAYGDAVLIDLAARLKELAPIKYEVHHVGGAEFALMTPSGSAAEGLRLGHFLKTTLAARHEVMERPVELDVAVGIAVAHEADTADSLVRHARTALGRAKAGQARGAAVFDVDLDAVVEERAELERDLRHALARDELFLVYQPTVDLRTRQPYGVEALVRWRHPTRGEIGAPRFIPVAEDSGLIVGIGAWVLRTACAQAARWHESRPDLRLSVNVSPRQLADPDFASMVHTVLADTDLDASCLCLEMTESVLMASDERDLATLRVLQRTGIDISIDDFGTGYSSLAYLQRLAVDELKIDRSFVIAIRPDDKSAIAMVRTILALARELSLAVVAEGIDEEEQVVALQAAGCDRGQGFLFSTPVPAHEITSML